MFERFTLEMVELPEATLRVRHGGSGSRSCCCTGIPAPTRHGTASRRCWR